MARLTIKITDYNRTTVHGRNCRVKLGKFGIGRGDKHVGVDMIMRLLEDATFKIEKSHIEKFIKNESKKQHDSRDKEFLAHLMKKVNVETEAEESQLEKAA